MRETVLGRRTYADLLLRTLEANKDLRVCALLLFCSEGNNVPEAQLISDCVVALLQLRGFGPAVTRPGNSWIAPVSWAQLLEKTDPDMMRQLYQ